MDASSNAPHIFFSGRCVFCFIRRIPYDDNRDVHVFGVWVVCLCSAFVPCLGGGQDFRLWRNHALAIASVFAMGRILFYLSVGKHLFEGVFLQNLTEFSQYFIKGAMSSPLAGSLSVNNALAGIGGLLYPVFYLATFLYAAGEVIVGKGAGTRCFCRTFGVLWA